MKRLVSIATLSFALLPAAVVAAESHNLTRALRGVYAVSGEGSCLHSVSGFANFRASPTPGNPGLIRSRSIHAIRTFNGDGTGTVTGRAVHFGHQPNPANGVGPNSTNTGLVTPTNFGPYFTEEISANFTYTVSPDRTIRIVNGPLSHRRTEGPNANPNVVEGVWTGIRIEGHVSQDLKMIVTATPSSDQLETEYATIANAQAGVNPTDFRHCHRSRVMVRISGGDDDDRGRGQNRFPF
jgi:hypothetical protein